MLSPYERSATRPRRGEPTFFPPGRVCALALLLAAACLSPSHAGPPEGEASANLYKSQTYKAQIYKIEPGSTVIEFEIDLLGVAPSSGAFHSFAGFLDLDLGRPENSSVDVEVAADSVEMGWEPADSTLRSEDYLDVGHFPHMRFTTASVHVDDARHVTIAGELTMRGVTKPMELQTVLENEHYDPVHAQEVAEFTVSGHVLRSDFGMTANSGMVGDEVRLRITSRVALKPG